MQSRLILWHRINSAHHRWDTFSPSFYFGVHLLLYKILDIRTKTCCLEHLLDWRVLMCLVLLITWWVMIYTFMYVLTQQHGLIKASDCSITLLWYCISYTWHIWHYPSFKISHFRTIKINCEPFWLLSV